jgi:hypothetical protein
MDINIYNLAFIVGIVLIIQTIYQLKVKEAHKNVSYWLLILITKAPGFFINFFQILIQSKSNIFNFICTWWNISVLEQYLRFS